MLSNDSGSMFSSSYDRYESVENVTSPFGRFHTRLRESIYGVVYVMLNKETPHGSLRVILGVCIQLCQMLGFVFNHHASFKWTTNAAHNLSIFLSYFQIPAYVELVSWNTYLAVFYIGVIIVALILADAVYVAYSFSRNRFRYMWPLKILREVTSIVVTTLFIPLVELFLIMFDCKNGRHYIYMDTHCWEGAHLVHIVLSAIVLVLFISFAIIISACYFEPSPTSHNCTSRVHSRVNLFELFAKVVLIFIFTFGATETWLLIIVMALLAGVNMYLHLLYLPFYHWRMCQIKIACTALYLWGIVCLFFASIQGETVETSNAELVFFLSASLFAYFAVTMASLRKQRLVSRSLRNIHLQHEVELMARFMLETSCNSEPGGLSCPDSYEPVEIPVETLEKVESFFQKSIQKFPKDCSVLIAYALFSFYHRNNKQLALVQLSKAESFSPQFDEAFSIYRHRKMVVESSNEGQYADVLSFIAYENHYNECSRYMQKSAVAHYRFWSELLSEKPNLDKLHDMGATIYRNVKHTEDHFRSLSRINGKSIKGLRAYGSFLTEVMLDPRGEIMMEQAQDIEEASVANRSSGTAMDDLYTYGNCFITVSAHAVRNISFGQILNASVEGALLYGYSNRELIGRSVTNICPEPFNRFVMSLLDKHLKTGTGLTVNQWISGYGLNRNGYIFAVDRYWRQVVDNANGISFIALHKKTFTSQHVAITDSTGLVLSISAGIENLFSVSLSDVSSRSVSIVTYIPNFLQLVDHQFGEIVCFQHASIDQAKVWIDKKIIDKETFYVTRIQTVAMDSRPLGYKSDDDKSYIHDTGAFGMEKSAINGYYTYTRNRDVNEQEDVPAEEEEEAPLIGPADGPGNCLALTVEGLAALNSFTSTKRPLQRPPQRLQRSQLEESEDIVEEEELQQHIDTAQQEVTSPTASSVVAAASAAKNDRELRTMLSLRRVQIQVNKEPNTTINTVNSPLAGEKSSHSKRSLLKEVPGEKKPFSSRGSVTSAATGKTSFERARRNLTGDKKSTVVFTRLKQASIFFVGTMIFLAILNYALRVVDADTYKNSVSNIQLVGSQRAHAAEIAYSVRTLNLITNNMLYLGVNATAAYSVAHATLAADIALLSDAHTKLYLETSTSGDLYTLYHVPNITTIEQIVNGTVFTSTLSLGQVVFEMIAAASAISTATSLADTDHHLAFLINNVIDAVINPLDKAAQLYTQSNVDLVKKSEQQSMALMISNLAILFFVVLCVLMPVLDRVERNKTQVIKLFLDLPRPLVQSFAAKCHRWVLAKRSENDDMDDSIPDDGVLSEDEHGVKNIANEVSAGSTLEPLSPMRNLSATNRPYVKTLRSRLLLMLKFSLLVLLVIGVTIGVYIDAKFMFQSTSQYNSKIDFSSRRQMLASYVNLAGREWLLYKKYGNSLVTDASWMEEWMDGLKSTEQTLTVGGNGFSSSVGIDDDLDKLTYYNACVYVPTDSRCLDFQSGVNQHGLDNIIHEYILYANNLASGANINYTDVSNSFILDDFNNYIRIFVPLASTRYQSIVLSYITAFQARYTVIVAVYIVVLVLLYMFLYHPLINKIQGESIRTRSLLMMVPVDIARKVPSIAQFIKNHEDTLI